MKKIKLFLIILTTMATYVSAEYAYYQNLDMTQVKIVASSGSGGFIFIPANVAPATSNVPNNDMNSSSAKLQVVIYTNYVIAYIPSKEMFALLLAAKNNGDKIEWLTVTSGNESKGMCDLTGTTWWVHNAIR